MAEAIKDTRKLISRRERDYKIYYNLKVRNFLRWIIKVRREVCLNTCTKCFTKCIINPILSLLLGWTNAHFFKVMCLSRPHANLKTTTDKSLYLPSAYFILCMTTLKPWLEFHLRIEENFRKRKQLAHISLSKDQHMVGLEEYSGTLTQKLAFLTRPTQRRRQIKHAWI